LHVAKTLRPPTRSSAVAGKGGVLEQPHVGYVSSRSLLT
jgi:hypothetical protein